MYKRVCVTILCILVSVAFAEAHQPKNGEVSIAVDLSSKRMTVHVGREKRYTWNVATGPGQSTRAGTFSVQSLSADHYSSIYNNEPMPHSIFYDGNRAIHGTNKKLSGHETHGCIALSPSNAAALFKLVSQNEGRTRIIVMR
jgi:lipoprotein-anchoring transpeptidase ErfK/SrfK